MIKDEKDRKIFSRGNEKLVAFRFLKDKWKAEYFVGKRLSDSTGLDEEGWAKVLMMEMGVLK